MKLAQYLFENNMTVKEFSELIGFQKEYVSSVKSGKKRPGRKMRIAIQKATYSQVGPSDWEFLDNTNNKEKKRITKENK